MLKGIFEIKNYSGIPCGGQRLNEGLVSVIFLCHAKPIMREDLRYGNCVTMKVWMFRRFQRESELERENCKEWEMQIQRKKEQDITRVVRSSIREGTFCLQFLEMEEMEPDKVDLSLCFDSNPSDVEYGTLANGFQYYVRSNANPPKNVFVTLLVRAG